MNDALQTTPECQGCYETAATVGTLCATCAARPICDDCGIDCDAVEDGMCASCADKYEDDFCAWVDDAILAAKDAEWGR